MKILQFVLLLSLYCIHAKSIPFATELGPFIPPLQPNTAPNVTFLDNKSYVDETQYGGPIMRIRFGKNLQSNDPFLPSEGRPLFFLDLHQLFQSAIRRMKDPVRIEGNTDKTPTVEEEDELFSRVHQHDHTESVEMTATNQDTCEHGLNGFCPHCDNAKRNDEHSSIDEDTNMITLPNILPMNAEQKSNEKDFHLKHYFLSTSGDTEKSVAAPKDSVLRLKRVKRFHGRPLTIFRTNNENNEPQMHRYSNSDEASASKNVANDNHALFNFSAQLANFDKLLKQVQRDILQENMTNDDVDKEDEQEQVSRKADEGRYFGNVPIQAVGFPGNSEHVLTLTLSICTVFFVLMITLCILRKGKVWCCSLCLQSPPQMQDKLAEDKMVKMKKPKSKNDKSRQ